jgi:GNAT superfamily N-acetyltransferase
VLSLVPRTPAAGSNATQEGGHWRLYDFVEGSVARERAERRKTRGPRRAVSPRSCATSPAPAARRDPAPLPRHAAPPRGAPPRSTRTPITARRTARAEIAAVERAAPLASALTSLRDAGTLPTRIVHNDTKINNLLLDERTGRELCVIDLDTVMPGLALYDFGDLVRTVASASPEDEPDAGRVAARPEFVLAAARGWIEGSAALCYPPSASAWFSPPACCRSSAVCASSPTTCTATCTSRSAAPTRTSTAAAHSSPWNARSRCKKKLCNEGSRNPTSPTRSHGRPSEPEELQRLARQERAAASRSSTRSSPRAIGPQGSRERRSSARIANSLCSAAYAAADGAQVAFARLITDHATFGYLADVFVLPEHRGQGLGAAVVHALLDLPEVRAMRRLMLATRDAHALYAGMGFTQVEDPRPFMQILRPDVYRPSSA